LTRRPAATERVRRETSAHHGAFDLERNERLVEYRFTVEGHADPRGHADTNMTLSQERAESVKRYLTGQGIAEDRLIAEGHGDREPMLPAEPAAPENRRVTFVTQKR